MQPPGTRRVNLALDMVSAKWLLAFLECHQYSKDAHGQIVRNEDVEMFCQELKEAITAHARWLNWLRLRSEARQRR